MLERVGQYEEASTGKERVRQLLTTLIADLKALPAAGRPGWVMMTRVDRVGRGRIDASLFAQHEILDLGVRIWTRDDGEIKLESSHDEFKAAAKAYVSRIENDNRIDKLKEMYARKRAAGLVVGSKLPYGVLLGADGRAKPDPKRAPVVKAAFALRATGAGYHVIGKRLSAIAPPAVFKDKRTQVVRWTPTRVKRLLELHTYVDAAIITEGAFVKAQRATSGVGPAREQVRIAWPLSGSVRCYCGRALVGVSGGAEHKRIRYYHCRADWNHGGSARAVHADELEAAFVVLLRSLHASPETAARYRRAAIAPAGSIKTLEKNLHALRGDLEKAKGASTAVWDLHSKGLIKDAHMAARLDTVAATQRDIEDRIATAEAQRGLFAAAAQNERDAQAVIAKAARTYARGSDEDRRDIVRALALDLGGLCLEANGKLAVRRAEDPDRQRKRRANEA
jgi:DNA invertase Pin-like site-specific DNA recombinase